MLLIVHLLLGHRRLRELRRKLVIERLKKIAIYRLTLDIDGMSMIGRAMFMTATGVFWGIALYAGGGFFS